MERKFDVMAELGTDLILVCSSVSPDAVDDDDRIAEQLHALAARAAERGLRVSYEALAWGRFVNTYERSWEIVRRADHPALGLCVDSFHVLSRDVPTHAIETIPAEKIFFLQLADAPTLPMDVLYWSRHYRCFPGQGDLDVAGYSSILASLPFIVIAFAAFVWLARPLNLLSLGAEAAGGRGLDVRLTQRVAFFSASLATGAAVAVGGPIGFVGIIVPHLVRLLVGADHRLVLPASTFFGAAFLVACDVVARTALAPLELPVGIMTALIGGQFFLWLLLWKL
jgi:hypothetical protein